VSESTGPAKPTTSPTKPAGTTEKPAKPPKAPKPAKKPPTPEQLERRSTIIRFAIFVGVGAVLTVLLYFALSAFIPRWWAQSIGGQVAGRIGTGILLGLLYGFLFTFLPLLVLAQAFNRSFTWQTRIAIVLGAVLLTAPNLMTLGIAVGTGRAAQAADRTLDVAAPGFRYATVWGAVLGGVLAVAVTVTVALWQRRSRELTTLRARLEELEKEVPRALPTPPPRDPPKPGP
jgi:hypothetical protein